MYTLSGYTPQSRHSHVQATRRLSVPRLIQLRLTLRPGCFTQAPVPTRSPALPAHGIAGNPLSWLGLKHLSEQALSSPNRADSGSMEELMLDHCDLAGRTDLSQREVTAGLMALSKELMSCSTDRLATLSLTSNNIGAEGVQVLVEGLARNQGLTALYLSQNPIGSLGAEALAAAFYQSSDDSPRPCNTRLRELHLDGCSLLAASPGAGSSTDVAGIRALGRVVGQRPGGDLVLNVADNALGKVGCYKLGAELKALVSKPRNAFTRIDLSTNGVPQKELNLLLVVLQSYQASVEVVLDGRVQQLSMNQEEDIAPSITSPQSNISRVIPDSPSRTASPAGPPRALKSFAPDTPTTEAPRLYNAPDVDFDDTYMSMLEAGRKLKSKCISVANASKMISVANASTPSTKSNPSEDLPKRNE
ncbi:hypothetical protein CYMTET_48818 [Cymbomonas tetramitiformis]|uniref:Uncharacterized protein n=1 Tax=Cymbomonas tetramitiformis TaxID=36881 RepID=A0AAE0EUR7_9CHLO|nr:hypothetical protein CYMTET_48818 [Cymbomonas tetramitiformis]